MMRESTRSILRTYRRLQLRTPFVTSREWSSSKRYLLTAGFGPRFAHAAQRLSKQARACGWFDEVWSIDEKSALFDIGPFLTATAGFRQQHGKGFGLWCWKPYLVSQALSTIEPGAHLYYIDAGCEISIFGEERLKAIDSHIHTHGSGFFTLPFAERNWTKPALLQRLRVNQQLASMPQIQATWFGLANVPATRALISRWWQESSRDDFWALRDDYGEDDDAELIEHRHDQSVLSCVVKGSVPAGVTLPWEDFYAPWLYHRNSFVLLEPVHALRNDSQRSSIDALVKGSTLTACYASFHGQGSLLPPLARRLYYGLRDEVGLLANRIGLLRRA